MPQLPPRGDQRRRVNNSAKFYVAELHVGTAGGTWHFTESAERIVYRFPGGVRKVTYRSRYYQLHAPSEMISLVDAHRALGGTAIISGRNFNEDHRPFTPFEFIDITEPSELERFKAIVQARSREILK